MTSTNTIFDPITQSRFAGDLCEIYSHGGMRGGAPHTSMAPSDGWVEI